MSESVSRWEPLSRDVQEVIFDTTREVIQEKLVAVGLDRKVEQALADLNSDFRRLPEDLLIVARDPLYAKSNEDMDPFNTVTGYERLIGFERRAPGSKEWSLLCVAESAHGIGTVPTMAEYFTEDELELILTSIQEIAELRRRGVLSYLEKDLKRF